MTAVSTYAPLYTPNSAVFSLRWYSSGDPRETIIVNTYGMSNLASVTKNTINADLAIKINRTII